MKKNEVETMSVFSKADYDTLEQASAIIRDCQAKSDGLAQTIAGQLFIVSQKKLYELEDFKTVHEWAMSTHDISKGTVSDSINTFARFGDGVTGNLLPKYSAYTFSTLMRMKSLTDEQIELAGINPTMSRSQVIDAIKALKVLEEKQAELPKLEKQWADMYKELAKYMDKEERIKWVSAVCPKYYEDSDAMTAEDYDDLIKSAETAIEVFENGEVVEDAVEHGQAEQQSNRNSAVEHEEQDEDQQDEEEEQEEEEEEYSESMPCQWVNINEYRKADGTLSKSKLLEDIWNLIVSEVEPGNCDVAISNME